MPHGISLNTKAIFFDYIVIGKKHFHISCLVGINRTSLSYVIIPDEHEGYTYGEIPEIFQIDQAFSDII